MSYPLRASNPHSYTRAFERFGTCNKDAKELTIIPGPYGWFGRPFKALLLVQQPNEKNERITAENEVGLSGLGTNVALKNIRTRDFETL